MNPFARRGALSPLMAATACGVILALPLAGAGAHTAPRPALTATISKYKYLPSTLTVRQGSTVVWTNRDVDQHTITSDVPGMLDSGSLKHNSLFRHTFNSAGTIHYHCSYHSFMTGTITVRPKTGR